jgi:hypothetical protein
VASPPLKVKPLRDAVLLAALLSVVPSTSALVLCTMPNGSKFMGDNPPASCNAATSVSDEKPSSPAPQRDDALSKTAAGGPKLIEQREAARKAEQTRESATHVTRDSQKENLPLLRASAVMAGDGLALPHRATTLYTTSSSGLASVRSLSSGAG